MGGSGGGGGSSGSVDYPDYMKERHSVLYDNMRELADEAIANNPYVGMYGWDPTCMIAHMEASVDYYDHIIQDFEPLDVWQELMSSVPSQVYEQMYNEDLENYIDSMKTRMRNGVENEILPKYRRGMQDIGAVVSSAFKIGEALLWAKELEEERAADVELRGKLFLIAFEQAFKSVGDIISLTLQKISYNKEVVHYNMEALRLGYVAMKEYVDSNNIYKVEEAKWSLEMSKYMMDCLGCIASSAGTSYTTSTGGASRAASAIGGALGGVLAGTKASGGDPIGAVIGGAAGLVAGLF